MNRDIEDRIYEIVETKSAALGRFCIRLDTVEESGELFPYSYVEGKTCVGILAFSEDRVVLVRQYRHAIGIYEYEIPGGSIEPGETPRAVAQRELLEETGYEATEMESLGYFYPSPSSIRELCYLFVVNCKKRWIAIESPWSI